MSPSPRSGADNRGTFSSSKLSHGRGELTPNCTDGILSAQTLKHLARKQDLTASCTSLARMMGMNEWMSLQDGDLSMLVPAEAQLLGRHLWRVYCAEAADIEHGSDA